MEDFGGTFVTSERQLPRRNKYLTVAAAVLIGVVLGIWAASKPVDVGDRPIEAPVAADEEEIPVIPDLDPAKLGGKLYEQSVFQRYNNMYEDFVGFIARMEADKDGQLEALERYVLDSEESLVALCVQKKTLLARQPDKWVPVLEADRGHRHRINTRLKDVLVSLPDEYVERAARFAKLFTCR